MAVVHRIRILSIGVAALVVGGLLAACEPGPTSLEVRTVASGLSRPWDLAFLPDGSMVITERGGRVRLRTPNGQLRTLAEPDDVVVASEGGMLGVAVDPAFASNRRIYTCFMSDAGSGVDVRLVRWRLTNAADRLHLRSDIVTGMPVNEAGQLGRHSGCRPRFGPDGRLWVGTGDAATGSVPQDPTSLGGKVLRVDTDGNGVAGNAPAPYDSRIYSSGHRNVQGIAFSPGGRAFSIEHGTGRDDEINRLVAGANYGWDPVPAGGGGGYDESRPMTDLGRHPGARTAAWSSGDPTIAPSGGTFLSSSRWGSWRGVLAMAVLKGQQLRFVRFDGSGTTTADQWVRVTDLGRLRVAVEGPDGDLYVVQDAATASIYRVSPR
jgi:glucose/arabinose dehydrogenase